MEKITHGKNTLAQNNLHTKITYLNNSLNIEFRYVRDMKMVTLNAGINIWHVSTPK